MSRMNSMPVGYRFHPTDEELISHYLRLKMQGNDSRVRDIAEVNICDWDPWDLPQHSAIKSDDPEWFFFSPRDFKYSNSRRTNRTTAAGYWKPTGKDRSIKARGRVIGTKKTLVFHTGRVPRGVRTGWVMHEYHPVDPPQQKAYVICRLKNKTDETTNVLALDDGEASSYTASDFEISVPDDTVQEEYLHSEGNLESIFPQTLEPQYYNLPSPLQFPAFNAQGFPFSGSMVATHHDDEEDENTNQFLNSLLVDQDEEPVEYIHSCDTRAPKSLRKVHFVNGGFSSDTDTDTAQTRYETLVGTSTSYTGQVSPKEYRQTHMLKVPYAPADICKQIDCLELDRAESSPRVRTFTSQRQERSRHSVGQKAAQGRSQSQRSSAPIAASQDKAKDGSRRSPSHPQKVKSSSNSHKVQKVSPKSTSDGSAGRDSKGYFTFQDTSQPCQDSTPPYVYFVNVFVGVALFLIVIRELVLHGSWC